MLKNETEKHPHGLTSFQPFLMFVFFWVFLFCSACPDEETGKPKPDDSSNSPNTIEPGTQTHSDAGNQNGDSSPGDAGNQNGNSAPEDAGSTEVTPEPPACTCPDDYNLTPAGDACTKHIVLPATLEGTTYEVCDAQNNWVYGKFGAQYPDGTKVRNEYWGNSDGSGTVNGRLNEVGIWACNETTGQAGSNPTDEWIGFAHCLNLDGKGDYLVGIAGDNQVRLKLNGETIFEYLQNNTAAFNYWWISALHVNSGINIIEMQGYNAQSVASLGAEIAGPFPPDSLTSDEAMIAADYANKIVFSTGEMIGQSFDVGEESGWTCPEDYALNRCTAEPECTYLDTVPCGPPSESDGGTHTGSTDSGPTN